MQYWILSTAALAAKTRASLIHENTMQPPLDQACMIIQMSVFHSLPSGAIQIVPTYQSLLLCPNKLELKDAVLQIPRVKLRTVVQEYEERGAHDLGQLGSTVSPQINKKQSVFLTLLQSDIFR